mgnify:FL=1|tara:strand:+ start:770 stop:1498 length:729 start_codon:yes stop_codon:yes gene_type:complete
MKIGLIGGSGLSDYSFFDEPIIVTTKYGSPSSRIFRGNINNHEIFYIKRHGSGHKYTPTSVPYRANIKALEELGCEQILAITAVGSLREEIEPGHLVFPDQFIDMTKKRKTSFFEDGKDFTHVNMANPFDSNIRKQLIKCANKLNIQHHTDKTVITIEGLRFSTKAESNLWRSWGADIINMSTVPEVCLAKELDIPYQAIALSTDYDSWNEDHESVTMEMVMKQVNKNIDSVKQILNLYFNE